MIALATEDPYIEIAKVDTGSFGFSNYFNRISVDDFLGERVHALKTDTRTLAVAWHPKNSVLAYLQDDDSSSVRLFGVLD